MPDKVDKAINDLPIEEMRLFIQRVAEIFYWNPDDERWHTAKEWDGETVELVCQHFPESVRDAVDLESTAADEKEAPTNEDA